MADGLAEVAPREHPRGAAQGGHVDGPDRLGRSIERPRAGAARQRGRAATGEQGGGSRPESGGARPDGRRQWAAAALDVAAHTGGSGEGRGGSPRGRGRRGEVGKAADDEDWRWRFSGWGRGRRSGDSRPRRRCGRGQQDLGSKEEGLEEGEASRHGEEHQPSTTFVARLTGETITVAPGGEEVVAEGALVLAWPREATAYREEVGNGGNQRSEAANEVATSDRWRKWCSGGGLGKQSGGRPCSCDGEVNGASGKSRWRLKRRWRATEAANGGGGSGTRCRGGSDRDTGRQSRCRGVARRGGADGGSGTARRWPRRREAAAGARR
uniref:Uncharacterized protein n=1 Tax=Oryza sativa subsp. japonica TaxID=39947 RepID=Q8H5R2_ORYSJ|nr:hypothetical protein [Oryza sativa Japonica Group]